MRKAPMDSYAICGQSSPRSDCAFAQSDQGLHCPLTESFGSKDKKSGPFVVRLEEPVYEIGGTSMNAQADLGFEAFRLFKYYKDLLRVMRPKSLHIAHCKSNIGSADVTVTLRMAQSSPDI